MNEFEAYVALNMVGGIGSVRLKKLLEYFTKPQEIFKANAGKLTLISGIPQKLTQRISAFKYSDLDLELGLAKSAGLKIVTCQDKDYPENLKNIPDPAIVLYCLGEIKKSDSLSLGVVGSRRASFYGLKNAEKFAFELGEKGFTIVSGMARGIDTYAHRGALKSGGRTIACLGSGFNNIYPEENKELVQDISKSGCVISEFPVNAPPLKENFPRRNRIISGLSLGLLVVEAARNSGALITADFALEQNRDVFALPGNIDSSLSYGTNSLIKQGAKLVSSVDDILEEYSLRPEDLKGKLGLQEIGSKETVDSQEDILYSLISSEAVGIDDLIEKSNLSVVQISSILLKLQLKEIIRQLPGNQFVRSS